MNFWPLSTAHPARAPFSREITYIDKKGPCPIEIFDQTQDNLGAFFGSRTGTTWSMHREDFDREVFSDGHLGVFLITNNGPVGGGLTLTSMQPAFPGEHGVISGLGNTQPYQFEMHSGACYLSATADFLISCKVWIINRAHLDPFDHNGIRIGTDSFGTLGPAFAAGGNATTWQIWWPPDAKGAGTYLDTGITVLDTTNMPDQVTRAWNVLQISRVNGVIRWHINGTLVRLNGSRLILTGTETLLPNQEGLYWPNEIGTFCRYFQIRRFNPGPVNEGFAMDYFHRLCRR